MNLTAELANIVKGEVNASDETLAKYSRDASLFEVRPRAVVFPRDAADIQALVRFVRAHPEERLSLTPRAAGTDMSGGPLGESIIVDVGRHMNRILEVGDGYAVAEPGVFYRDFEKATLEKGWLLPSYPASRELCMIGGIVANNSGGEKTLVYGKTDRYVEELEVVLSDGSLCLVQPLSKDELEAKKKEDTLEGEVYRKAGALIAENREAIRAAKPNVSKNSAGYALWDVEDGDRFNLTKLFVGSQGTLGIVTKARLRLIRPKPHAKMLTIFLNNLAPLSAIITDVLKHKPESFESYDDKTFRLVVRFLPDFARLMKAGNMFSLAWKFLPEIWTLVRGGIPKLVLIAEFTGEDERDVEERVSRAEEAVRALGVATRRTRTKEESRKYWLMRRESFNLLRNHIRGKHTAPFIDDIVVRPEHLPEFLPELERTMGGYDLIYTIAGHIGDGNFHIIPLMNLKDPKARAIIPELSEKVYDLVIRYGGSITGEHNDGIVRTPYLAKMYGEKITALFTEVKRIFDSQNILNPGKKVGGTLEYAMAHLIKE